MDSVCLSLPGASDQGGSGKPLYGALFVLGVIGGGVTRSLLSPPPSFLPALALPRTAKTMNVRSRNRTHSRTQTHTDRQAQRHWCSLTNMDIMYLSMGVSELDV